MYFKVNARANYYDCDANDRLKISAAMRYMQQTSSEHLEALDLSPVRLFSEHMVFLLSKMCIKVHRMPLVAEPLVVGTAATTPRGARFVREFVIETRSGERLVSALSLWVLVDPETRRILRPASFPYPLPFRETVLGGAIEDMRFPRLPESGSSVKTRVEIRYSHIDTNSHVNNSIYADFVCDALPYDRLTDTGLDTLVIGYHNEARRGEIVEMTTSALADREYHISGLRGEDACFEALAILK